MGFRGIPLASISLIIFDLGKVIVDLSHLEMAAAMAEKSTEANFQNPSVLFSSIFQSDDALTGSFDEGKLPPQEFYKVACKRFHLNLSYDDFVHRWNRSFKENVGVTELIERLRPRYRLFLLSNTNPLHYAYLEKTIPALQKMEQKILSFEVGHRKPSPLIFQVALQRAGVPPQEILYIDDMAEYISAANGLGIQGIVYKSIESLEEELKRRQIILSPPHLPQNRVKRR